MADERYKLGLEDKLKSLGFDPRKIHEITKQWIEAEHKRHRIIAVVILLTVCFCLALNFEYLPIAISEDTIVVSWISFSVSILLAVMYWTIAYWKFKKIASPGPRFVYLYRVYLTETIASGWLLKLSSATFVFGVVWTTYDSYAGWITKSIMTILIAMAAWMLLNNLLFTPYQRLKKAVLNIG